MQIKKLHGWDLSYSQAIALQKQLAQQVQQIELKTRPKTIAGLDCALSSDSRRIVAAAVILIRHRRTNATQSLWETTEQENFEVIETATTSQEITFPYIPGLLSFRESPVCLAAVEKLKNEPDAFMIDGQGIAHPRRFGLAAHLGLFFDKPTIGCAKSRLTGNFEEPSPTKGAYSPLKDADNVIGAVLRTRTNVAPVFVSVGNKCLLKDAIEITLAWTTKYRLPEPTRLAHQLVSKSKFQA
jgi:deoxyribonuclease V